MAIFQWLPYGGNKYNVVTKIFPNFSLINFYHSFCYTIKYIPVMRYKYECPLIMIKPILQIRPKEELPNNGVIPTVLAESQTPLWGFPARGIDPTWCRGWKMSP